MKELTATNMFNYDNKFRELRSWKCLQGTSDDQEFAAAASYLAALEYRKHRLLQVFQCLIMRMPHEHRNKRKICGLPIKEGRREMESMDRRLLLEAADGNSKDQEAGRNALESVGKSTEFPAFPTVISINQICEMLPHSATGIQNWRDNWTWLETKDGERKY